MTEDLNDELNDRDYLHDLAERIFSIPVKLGVDQGDYDRLRWIANTAFSPDGSEAADRMEKWGSTLRRIGEDQRADDMELAIAALRRSSPRGVAALAPLCSLLLRTMRTLVISTRPKWMLALIVWSVTRWRLR